MKKSDVQLLIRHGVTVTLIAYEAEMEKGWSLLCYRSGDMASLQIRKERGNQVRVFKTLDAVQRYCAECGVKCFEVRWGMDS